MRIVSMKSMRVLLGLGLGCVALSVSCVPSRAEMLAPVGDDVQARVHARVHFDDVTAPDDVSVRDLLAAPLTRTSVVQVALLHNRGLQAHFAELGVAHAAVLQAGLLENPSVGLGMQFAPGTPRVDLGLDVSLNFLDALALPLRHAMAESALHETEAEVTTAVLTLAWQSERAWIDVVTASARARELRAADEVQATALDLATRLHDAGNVTDLFLLERKAMAAEQHLDADDAARDLELARAHLGELLGVDDDTLLQTADTLDAPTAVDVADLDTVAVQRSAALAGLAQRVRALDAQGGLTTLQSVVPELRVGASVSRDDGTLLVGPRAALTLPLFDPGTAKAAARDYELQRVTSEAAHVASTVRAQARRSRAQLLHARERTALLTDNLLPARVAARVEVQHAWNAMLTGPLQVLDARVDELHTRVHLLDEMRVWARADADVRALRAGHLPRMTSEEP
jgi:cobalt-zinc-cadmium efflux system outer membrane protein